MPSNTSTSKKEWFSKAMFWQTLSSFAPIPILYFIILFSMLPMDIFMWDAEVELRYGVYARLAAYVDYGRSLGLSTSLLFGCLSSMMVFRYLHNNRSSNMVHSLPIRREVLFTTQYIAGLCFCLVPNILIFVLTILACAMHGIFYPEPFVYLLMITSANYVFFYSFAVWCSSLTGSVGAVPIYYLVFNLIVVFVTLLMQPLFELYFLGFTGELYDNYLVELLTPVYALEWGGKVQTSVSNTNPGLENMYEVGGYFNPYPENITYYMAQPSILVGYLIVAVIMVLTSLYLYKKRHIETAGEAVSVPALKPLFHFVVSVLGGISLGVLTWALVFPDFDSEEVRLMLPVVTLFWGMVFALVAEMILQKSFRVLSSWKKGFIPLIAIGVLFLVIWGDVAGFEDYIPAEEKVDLVVLQGLPVFPRDGATNDLFVYTKEEGTLTSETYDIVTQLHQAMLDSARESENDRGYSNDWTGLSVYYGANRSSTNRQYILRETWQGEGALPTLLHSLVNDSSRIRQEYALDEVLSGRNLTVSTVQNLDVSVGEFGVHSLEEYLPDLTVAELSTFYEELVLALEKDLREGNLGQKFVHQYDKDYLENYYSNVFRLEWEQEIDMTETGKLSHSSDTEVSGSASGEVSILGDDIVVEKRSLSISFTVQSEHTLAVLEQYGILEEMNLLRNQEVLDYYCAWGTSGDDYWSALASRSQNQAFDVSDPLAYVWILT